MCPAERGPSGTGHDTRCPERTPVAVPGPASEPRYVLVIRFRERRNAEHARRQIVWAMERAHLIPFEIEIEEVDRAR